MQPPKKTNPWFCFGVVVASAICLHQDYVSSKKKAEKETEEKQIHWWMDFNDKLQNKMDGKIPPPFEPVEKLAQKYLKEPSTVLDIGCETGKNAACLIKNGHTVVLLDIAPNAIFYTMQNLKREGLDHGVKDYIISKIEDLPPEYGPYPGVVGTYAFSFIPPHIFNRTMEENVLKRVDQNGYFVGGFFGVEHAWASDKKLSILSTNTLESFFSSHNFTILEMSEHIQEVPTVANGITKFHTINVIAQKSLKQQQVA